MRLIVAELRVESAHADEFTSFMKGYIDKTRLEPGNQRFQLFASLDEPGSFAIVEQWADDDAIRSHFAQSYVHEFRKLRTRLSVSIGGSSYDVTSEGSLMGVLAGVLGAEPPE